MIFRGIKSPIQAYQIGGTRFCNRFDSATSVRISDVRQITLSGSRGTSTTPSQRARPAMVSVMKTARRICPRTTTITTTPATTTTFEYEDPVEPPVDAADFPDDLEDVTTPAFVFVE